jgi:hypothetical protein
VIFAHPLKLSISKDRNVSYNILRVGASTLGLRDVIPLPTMAISA